MRHARQALAHRIQRRERLRLVQRREIGQLLERLADVAVDHHRVVELRPAVHHPMADGVELADAVQHFAQPLLGTVADRRQVVLGHAARRVDPAPAA